MPSEPPRTVFRSLARPANAEGHFIGGEVRPKRRTCSVYTGRVCTQLDNRLRWARHRLFEGGVRRWCSSRTPVAVYTEADVSFSGPLPGLARQRPASLGGPRPSSRATTPSADRL